MDSLIGSGETASPHFPNPGPIESQERYVGEFDDLDYAREAILHQLSLCVQVVEAGLIREPSDLGRIANSLGILAESIPIILYEDDAQAEAAEDQSREFEDAAMQFIFGTDSDWDEDELGQVLYSSPYVSKGGEA